MNNINYSVAFSYKQRHTELTDDQIINHYKTLGLRELCEKYNVNLNSAYSYRQYHPGVTDTQVIIHFRPDLHINLLGEIVIPE